MGNTKHKMKKRKRHERQIAEGKREPRRKFKRSNMFYQYRRVRLSQLDREDVRRVLELVKDIEI